MQAEVEAAAPSFAELQRRLRPAELRLGSAAAAGHVPGSVTADRDRIDRLARLRRATPEPE